MGKNSKNVMASDDGRRFRNKFGMTRGRDCFGASLLAMTKRKMSGLAMTKVGGLAMTMIASFTAQAQTCTPAPSCAYLGYTQTAAECSGSGIKCPFGDAWNCTKKRASCVIGWIYYVDGTCTTPAAHTGSKVALGVVVYVNPDGIGGQVMSAWPVDAGGNKSSTNVGMIWAIGIYDIYALTNLSDSSASTDYNSCNNTDNILADRQTSYPAAQAARNYAPTPETRGKWCLPAAGIMTNIYNNQSAIQTAITKLGGVRYPVDCCTWSSSESTDRNAWSSYFSNRYGLYTGHKDYNYYVRPVLEF